MTKQIIVLYILHQPATNNLVILVMTTLYNHVQLRNRTLVGH